MKAEELKRYDAYPILVHSLREAIDAGDAYGLPHTMLTRWELILKGLGELQRGISAQRGRE